MEKLPETIDVNWSGGGSGSSSTHATRVEQYIHLLLHPLHREEALAMLNKERRREYMALMLWNAKNVSFILLEEITKAYKLLSPQTIDVKETTRVCNAMALLQCMASHPDIKMKMVTAKMPVYLYPFMNTTENGNKHFDYLRLTSLGVIGSLVKEQDCNAPEIIHFLLETEVVPLCLRCIEVGSELAKTVATFVISKILLYEEAQRYCSTFPERFYAIALVLSKTVDKFPERPSLRLLKHILTCFLRLAEVSRPCDALSKCYPAKLKDPAYLNFVCEDTSIRGLADQVLKLVTDPTI